MSSSSRTTVELQLPLPWDICSSMRRRTSRTPTHTMRSTFLRRSVELRVETLSLVFGSLSLVEEVLAGLNKKGSWRVSLCCRSCFRCTQWLLLSSIVMSSSLIFLSSHYSHLLLRKGGVDRQSASIASESVVRPGWVNLRALEPYTFIRRLQTWPSAISRSATSGILQQLELDDLQALTIDSCGHMNRHMCLIIWVAQWSSFAGTAE